MIGWMFFGALILCAVLGYLFVRFVVGMVPNPKWKDPVMVGLTLVLLASPFVDEVIGKYQFEALCKANGIESADVSKASGKRVRFHYDYAQEQEVSWQILPTTETELQIKDEVTDDVLVRYKVYHAKGGWLMRYTPVGMGSSAPMIFAGNGCDYNIEHQILSKNQIKPIN